MVCLLFILKIGGVIKHLNNFFVIELKGIRTDFSITDNFQGSKIVEHILEIPLLPVYILLDFNGILPNNASRYNVTRN